MGPSAGDHHHTGAYFNAIDLKPATQYKFQVHECDGLSCAPLSDVLTTGTEATGSNDVYFWLDKTPARSLATTPSAQSGGAVDHQRAHPGRDHAGRAPAPCWNSRRPACNRFHYGLPGGRLGPTVGVVNTPNNTLYPPGSVVRVGLPVVLRGSKFAPGGSAWIWVDGVQGNKAAAAQVGPLGNSQASFTMPMVGPENTISSPLSSSRVSSCRLRPRARCR